MDNPHDNIKTLCHAYEVMKRPPAVGLQVGSVPQEPAFTEMAELRKLIMKNARLLQPEQLVSGEAADKDNLAKDGPTMLPAGSKVLVPPGIQCVTDTDTPLFAIPASWKIIKD